MVTAVIPRKWDIYGLDNESKKCIYPRDPANYEFATMCDFRTKNIYVNPAKYCAFPYSLKLGSSIIAIFSEGDAHGDSDRQKMVRSNDNGLTWGTPVTFFENDTGVFDYSLLSGLMSTGDKIVLKVWTITKTSGGYTVVTNSTVSYGGLSYAMWSKPKTFSDGNLYRTGYAVNGSDIQSALFKSTDDGDTWAGVAVMFSGAGKLYSESDVEEYSTNNVVAFCREDTGDDNPIYRAYSTNLGVTWGAASQIDTDLINGRQPHLRKLADDSIILGTGDRSGTSGLSSGGDSPDAQDFTGITIWRSDDGFSTYSYRTPVTRMYSTDGGQPFIEELASGRIIVLYYATRAISTEPVIGSSSLDIDFLTASVAEPSPNKWASGKYFVPTLFGGTTPGSPTLTTAYGIGYRVGRMATVVGKMVWTDLGGASGQMYIGNLPWVSDFDNGEAVNPPLIWVGIHYSSTGSGIRGYLDPNNNRIVLTAESGTTSLNSATDASLTATGSIDFTVTYLTDGTD